MPDSLATIIERHHGDESGFSRHYLTLYALALGLEAKNVFEFGSGFSTPTLLAAKTGNDPDLATKYDGRFTYLEGDSRKEIKKIQSEVFDLVLHDGSHEWRVVYKDLRAIIGRVKHNGLVLVHDTEHIPTYRLKLAVFFALLFVRHEKVTLPYGYGLTIIRILGNRGNGAIETTWEKERKKRNLPV